MEYTVYEKAILFNALTTELRFMEREVQRMEEQDEYINGSFITVDDLRRQIEVINKAIGNLKA